MQEPSPQTVNPLETILPEWSLPTLSLTQWLLVGLLGIWLLLRIVVWSRRRTLGLRSLEGASQKRLDAASYQTGIDARKENLLAHGDKYAAERGQSKEPANAAIPPPVDNWLKWISFARIGTLIAASLNLGITLIAAVAAGGEVNEMVESISFSDRWEAVINKYWIGIAVAAVIVLLELGRWFSRSRVTQPPQQSST